MQRVFNLTRPQRVAAWSPLRWLFLLSFVLIGLFNSVPAGAAAPTAANIGSNTVTFEWQYSAQSAIFESDQGLNFRAWCIEYHDAAPTNGDTHQLNDSNRIHGAATTELVQRVFGVLTDPTYASLNEQQLSLNIAWAIWHFTDGTSVSGIAADIVQKAEGSHPTAAQYEIMPVIWLHSDDTSIQDMVAPLAVMADKGDLPDSFDTSSSNNGPLHYISYDLYLGDCVDAELAATVDSRAISGIDAGAGDDNSGGLAHFGSCSGAAGSDEDGVQLTTPLVAGAEACVAVSAVNNSGASANLYGWIDFNGDGDFDGDADELLATGDFAGGVASVPVGTMSDQAYCFTVPAGATFDGGETHLRFRLTSDALSGATPWGGAASDGEVEDYYQPLACVGNLVWMDNGVGGGVSANGIQDGGEAGIDNVDVNLVWAGSDGSLQTTAGAGTAAGDDRLYSTTTASGGQYQFCSLLPESETVTSAASQTDSVSNTSARSITDNGCISGSFRDRSFVMADDLIIENVTVGVNISHSYRGDLEINLISPDGVLVMLAETSNDFDNNYDVLFADSGGVLDNNANDFISSPYYTRDVAPTQDLAVLNGQHAAGTWTLRICDAFGSDVGTFNRGQLNITGHLVTETGAGDALYRIDLPTLPAQLSPAGASVDDNLDSDGTLDVSGTVASSPAFVLTAADYSGTPYLSLLLAEAGFLDIPGSLNGYPDGHDNLSFDFGFYAAPTAIKMGLFSTGATTAMPLYILALTGILLGMTMLFSLHYVRRLK